MYTERHVNSRRTEDENIYEKSPPDSEINLLSGGFYHIWRSLTEFARSIIIFSATTIKQINTHP